MIYRTLTDKELIHAADSEPPSKELQQELANRLWDALYKLRQGEARGLNA
jgi:hypothetical protein